MHFKRQKQLTKWQKIKRLFYPDCGFKRAYKYYLKQLFRLNSNPHSIALGAALGIGIAITPFIGLQIVFTFILDFLLHANVTASLIFSIIGNPITFPIIWIVDYSIGNFFLLRNNMDNSSFLKKIESIKQGMENSDWSVIGDNLYSILFPTTIGGFILGTIIGTITYMAVLRALNKYNKAKLDSKK